MKSSFKACAPPKPQTSKRRLPKFSAWRKLSCQLVRVTVNNNEAAEAIKEIKKRIHIPLVADIHFNYQLALKAIENGIDKVRINPGNIGSRDKVEAVVKACKERGIPIRIGVNAKLARKPSAGEIRLPYAGSDGGKRLVPYSNFGGARFPRHHRFAEGIRRADGDRGLPPGGGSHSVSAASGHHRIGNVVLRYDQKLG